MVRMIDDSLTAVVAELRRAGARFAYIFGSRATGGDRPSSDVDVAAWFGDRDVDILSVSRNLRGAVDLLVLDRAPLEVAGRVATQGRLLFDDAPGSRVAWEATTRRIWFDEQPRMARARQDFVAGARARGRP